MAFSSNNQQILWKTLIILTVLTTIATTIYLAIFIKQFIDNRDKNGIRSSNPLHSNQNSDDAKFDSFGPHMEPLWRAFLIANLIAIALFTLYIPIALYYQQYYVFIIYTAFMFTETILSISSEYLAVSYRFSTIIYCLTALMTHCFCHHFRLNILNEMNLIRKNMNDE